MQRWNPPIETTPAEKQLLKLVKKQKLWGFLRHHRHELLDERVRAALRGMYAESGRGAPRSPERLALALLLQVGFGVADHEVPALTVVDQRWRMVLDFHDESGAPAFSQGTVFNFRERAIQHGLIDVLLERTVNLARETGGFSHTRLRVLIDSSPLVGAGRVEDTFNLIGRAVAQLVGVAAKEAGLSADEVAAELSLTVVTAQSVKAALDVDWRLPSARQEALGALLDQFDRLRRWLVHRFGDSGLEQPPLSEALALVEALVEQDTEPDPDSPDADAVRIRRGGANRRISVSDPDMRHGRKSKTKLFSGYKRHASVDADLAPLIVGVAVVPANVMDHEGAQPLLEGAERQGLTIVEAHVDRGYLASTALHERRRRGMRLISKPPTPPRLGDRFNKSDFDINLHEGTVTCRGGRTVPINWGAKTPAASFSRRPCTGCEWVDRCQGTKNARRVLLHPHEALFQQMAAELGTSEGRAERRKRAAAEHAMARMASVQGHKARYRGLLKNTFHATAAAVVVNCFVIGTMKAAA